VGAGFKSNVDVYLCRRLVKVISTVSKRDSKKRYIVPMATGIPMTNQQAVQEALGKKHVCALNPLWIVKPAAL